MRNGTYLGDSLSQARLLVPCNNPESDSAIRMSDAPEPPSGECS